jgi:hypothetical protein
MKIFNIFLFILLLFLSSSINSVSIETKSGKLFENVTIQNESEHNIEFSDEDGLVSILRKDSIKNYYRDKSSESNIKANDESLQTPIIYKYKPEKSEFTILLNQSVANDGAFQGASLFGERQSRRNNDSYKPFNEAWNMTTGIDFLGLTKGLQMGITTLNPIVDRTNTDSDMNYQSASGGTSKNSTVVNSINSGSLLYDPNQIKPRKEKNGLSDYLFSRINYEHNSAFGIFGLGLLFINTNTPTYIMRSLFIITWKPPFLNYFNPVLSINNRMLSEVGGIYQGNHNYRLSISHEYLSGEKFRITPSLIIGYQDVNNNIDMKKGISDISPRLQFNYLNYYLALNYMFRVNPYLVDTKYYYPDIGTYADADQNDNLTINPSKVNGLVNTYIVETISANVSNDLAKNYLINKYQQQKIVSGIFFFNIGYTLRF